MTSSSKLSGEDDELESLNARLQFLLRQGQVALDTTGPLTPQQSLSVVTAHMSPRNVRRKQLDRQLITSPLSSKKTGSTDSQPPSASRWQLKDSSDRLSVGATDGSSTVDPQGDADQSNEFDEYDDDDALNRIHQELGRLQSENIQLKLELQTQQQQYDTNLAVMNMECAELRTLIFQLSDMLRREMHAPRLTGQVGDSSIDGSVGGDQLAESSTYDHLMGRRLASNASSAFSRTSSVPTEDERMEPQFTITKTFMMRESEHPVTRIKFANGARTLVAFGSMDGRITIAQVTTEPSVLHSLDAHPDGVLDFDWSFDNERLATVGGNDKQAKVWDTKTGHLLRAFSIGSNTSSCVFFPSNSTLLVVGSSTSISIYNLTTGRANGRERVPQEVTALCFNCSGNVLFVGDVGGYVTSYDFNPEGGGFFGKPILTRKYRVSLGAVITGLQYHRQRRSDLPDSLLLVNMRPNVLCLFSVDRAGELKVERQYSIDSANRQTPLSLRAALTHDSCIVTGNLHNTVMVIDTRSAAGKKSKKAELYGHGTPVLDVALNNDNSVLLTGDESGVIIVWRRTASLAEENEL
eukprot:comp18972_c0_seq1/m.21270 comp18972_c0_seq1/g.21270  ORF comp18972_c0_seq1/g.21270 comp18972_c0_seq1/m.21270 type:complete len:579 (-) comp18972_c0_seq1:764-2500(-)